MNKELYIPSSRFTDVLALIPVEWRDLFSQYFILATKHKTLNEQKWKMEFPTFKSSTSAEFSNPDSPNLFEINPITYIINTHNALVDFPGALNRDLKLFHHRKKIPLSKEDFLKVLNMVRNESETRNWLTPTLKKLFRALVLYPLASTKELANKLDTTTNKVRQQIDRFRNRFIINRVIIHDYYKFGLSRVFLFLTFKNRHNITLALPVTEHYFQKEIPHRLDIFSDLFSIQIYCPPRWQWNSFKKLCEEKYRPNEVEWLGGDPRFFFMEENTVLYNTDTYDKSRKQWIVNENYLNVCLSTDLWQDLPRVDVSPALHLTCDINTPRYDFDLLDLKIIHYFYELEGNNNRFATVGTVANELDIPYQEAKTRLQRMLETNMVTFYYLTSFRLPRTVDIIFLAEDPKICDHYLNLSALLPCSHTAKIRSYPPKYVGIYSTVFLPHGSRVPYIFRDFFLANQDVITGFCAESMYTIVPRRPLWHYWDSVRHRWRWSDLPD
ncbi:MAG: hypothetical protein ACFFCW_05465 [Candidatus Hodarchaeota archaeon]